MSSNPFIERAEAAMPRAEFDQPAETAVAWAVLALVHEQRTANLIAMVPHLRGGAQSRTLTQLYSRLALTKEV